MNTALWPGTYDTKIKNTAKGVVYFLRMRWQQPKMYVAVPVFSQNFTKEKNESTQPRGRIHTEEDLNLPHTQLNKTKNLWNYSE